MITGSVGRAAESLSISQPALSRLIALLEQELGFELFLRRPGHPLQPTKEADAFYIEVNRIYVGLEHLQKVGSEIRAFQGNHLRVTGTPFLANSLLSLATAEFLEAFPASAISIDARPHDEVLAMVASRQQDLGVVVLPVHHSGIEVRKLMTVKSYCVMARDHPLAEKARVRLADLAGADFISNIFGSQLQESSDALLQRRNIEPRRRVFVRNQEMACSLVAGGRGLAILTPPFPDHVACYPGICFRPVDEEPENDIGLIMSNLRQPARMVRRFIDRVETVAREHSGLRYDG